MFCQYHNHQIIKEYIIKLIHARNLLRLIESEEKNDECLVSFDEQCQFYQSDGFLSDVECSFVQ